MNYVSDLASRILSRTTVGPVLISTTGGGTTIDLIDADGACFAIQAVGARSSESTNLAGKIQESDDGNTWSDVASAAFTAVTTDSNLQMISFFRTKRYVRHYRTLSGTTPGATICVIIGQAKKTQ
jgi:hypothetical protein